MKEYLAEIVRGAPTPAGGRNVLREYLQARILGCLQRAGAMIPLAFHGGTALRFLFRLPRYSEDLDFALEHDRGRYDFRAYLQAIRSELSKEGYVIEFRVNDAKTVHGAFVRFPGLPFEMGLSPHRDETIAVKIEVDTNPPAGATLATTVVRRYVTLQLQHHDRASLLAGKLHALLQRKYVKGRDIYDLVWYLSDRSWPEPNLIMLANALRQTGREAPYPERATWRAVLRARLLTVSWDRVVQDAQPFLETQADTDLLNRDTVIKLLQSE